MGNAESQQQLTEQQQFIQQLQSQINQNQNQIESLKYQHINQMSQQNNTSNNYNHQNLNNYNYQNNKVSGVANKLQSNQVNFNQSSNQISNNLVNPLLPSNDPINTFYQNQEQQKIINSITKNPRKTIQDNNDKLDKLYKIQAQYRHLMTNQQHSKVKHLINQLQTSNEVLATSTNNKMFLHNYGTRSQDPNVKEIEVSHQINDINQLSTHYHDQEERENVEFEIEQKKRQREFLESQRQRRHEYKSRLGELEKKNIDAIKLFSLSNNYSVEQLKVAYKRLAMQTHPDRPGGSKQKFQLITQCYLSLMEKYKLRESDKTYNDLRQASKEYISSQQSQSDNTQVAIGSSGETLDKKNFNAKLFNKLYEQHKLWDPNDDGYQNWLSSTRDEPDPTPLFSNKFNLDVFNNTFSDMKNKGGDSQIVKHDGPTALVSCGNGFTELDNTNQVQDFTRPLEGATKGIAYTDLKTAYTSKGNLIDPNSVEYKQYKSVDELKRDRSRIKYEMTPEQLRQEQIRKAREEEAERIRQDRIRQRDIMVGQNYSKSHQAMLGYRSSGV
jgi:curved DNA-binding protein CbpA